MGASTGRGIAGIRWPLLGAAAIALPGIWILPVCDTSEARYAEISREMVDGGDWLVPRRMGKPHLTKPPLTYWLSALSMEVLGTRDWAARLPGALAFIGAVLVTADLGRQLWGSPAAGGWSGLALACSALPAAAANILTADSLLAFLVTAAAWAGWRCLAAEGPREGRAWAAGFHGLLGLAFLAKGPPGLLIALALIPFALVRRRAAAGRLLWPPALALFAAIALPWYILMAWKIPGTLETWLDRAVAERLAGDSHRNMPFLLYLPILLAGALPAGLALPGALGAAWRRWRSGGAGADAVAFLALWTGVPFAVFCAAGSRLPLYPLPLFPPLALLAGHRLASWAEGRGAAPALAVEAVAALSAGGIVARSAILGGPAIPGFPELVDPRPAAAAIAGDARREGRVAEVLATSPPLNLTGDSLAFYLGLPVGRINLRSQGGTSAGEPAAIPAAGVLAGAAREGTIRYVAVRPRKAGMLEERAREAGARGMWLLSEGPLWVWKVDG